MAKNMNDKCTEVTFRFGLHGDSGAEDFLAKTDDEAVINQAREQLAKPEPERRLIITGPIQRVPISTGAGSTLIRPGNSPT